MNWIISLDGDTGIKRIDAIKPSQYLQYERVQEGCISDNNQLRYDVLCWYIYIWRAYMIWHTGIWRDLENKVIFQKKQEFHNFSSNSFNPTNTHSAQKQTDNLIMTNLMKSPISKIKSDINYAV